MSETADTSESTAPPRRTRRMWGWVAVIAATALVTFAITALLTNIVQRKGEGQATYTQVVALDESTVDPAIWGENFPVQYEAYLETADFTPTAHNPALVKRDPTADDPRTETTGSKIEEDPRLTIMWAGNAFAKDYRHLRGHEYMLEDQQLTLRVTAAAKPQPGACLNCHASTVTIMNELGDGDTNAGFDAMNAMLYTDATQLASHPVSCIDCHDPATMELRITRPALINGLAALKASQGIADYDVNRDATRLEMRSYVCAQCHVEYYFAGDGKTLTFPWNNGTDLNDVYEYYDEIGFQDFEHAITGASILKAQHPEFEVWSAGVHAANGVSCADCHMNYVRNGSQKVTNHDITSPMTDVNATCGTCHKADTDTLTTRVTTIQNRYVDSRDRALDSLTQLIGAIETAMSDGTPQEYIDTAKDYQRFASFYVDYAYSENSYGFHAPDYMQRILSQSLDASRKGQLALLGVSADTLAASDVAAANTAKTKESGLY